MYWSSLHELDMQGNLPVDKLPVSPHKFKRISICRQPLTFLACCLSACSAMYLRAAVICWNWLSSSAGGAGTSAYRTTNLKIVIITECGPVALHGLSMNINPHSIVFKQACSRAYMSVCVLGSITDVALRRTVTSGVTMDREYGPCQVIAGAESCI